jgi:hypothetical protein
VDWSHALDVAHLVFEAGIIGLVLRLNYKWNTVLDRVDLLYKAYCDEHKIPFKGLNNDFDQ